MRTCRGRWEQGPTAAIPRPSGAAARGISQERRMAIDLHVADATWSALVAARIELMAASMRHAQAARGKPWQATSDSLSRLRKAEAAHLGAWLDYGRAMGSA